MDTNPYTDTVDLLGVIATAPTAPNFFLDRYFRGDNRLSVKEEISFDEVLEGLPVMAPYVFPDVAGKAQSGQGYQTKVFRPAYLKPKNILKPKDSIKRRPGEPLTGDLSPERRRDLALIDLLEYQKSSIMTRLEYMAARALIDGKVKIEGEDYPTKIVDFCRDPNNTVNISSANDKWSNDKADIASQLEDFADQILIKSGSDATDIIMSPTVWKAFKANKSILAEADLRRGITNIPNLTPQANVGIGAQYKGDYGSFSIFVYARSFREQNGEDIKVLGDNEILVVARPDETGKGGVEGVKAFGAILDHESLTPIDLFPKTWVQQDPSGLFVMTQSAPLMIPGRPNATLKATVL